MIPNLKLIAIAAVVIALLGAAAGLHHHGVVAGRAEVQAKWEKDKLARTEASSKAVLKAVADNKAAHQKDLTDLHQALKKYETTIDTQSAAISIERAARNAERMFFNARGSCYAPAGQAAGTFISNGEGAATKIELPDPYARNLRDLAEDADREIARKDAKIALLQQWIRDRGFYGPD